MAPQDSFIDEDDDCCPLCVEEFDLSDRNFRPCPCGYQVCQFCYNNIKNNMNGLCPACRRPYDEKTIEWKVVTQEEMAQFKANIQKNAKKKAEQRQKEAQKREVESLNRKHLSGLRVVQKNLVYVVGLSPGIREDEILQTLRGDKYFGQYGKIIKIVVSKSKQGDAAQSAQGLGVYVTFARKEDAAKCIAAVNGSQNGERTLRAQLGTTKYCSAYLRNEICTNKQCMFLHEPGDNDDSYSRQDLSSINSASAQLQHQPAASSSGSALRQPTQAPLQQAQPVAAAAQPMARDSSKDGSESGDGSALPSSASWANRGVQQRSRRGSLATSGVASSPAVSQSMPAAADIVEEPPAPIQEPEPEAPILESSPVEPPRQQRDTTLLQILKAINVLSRMSQVSRTDSTSFPPLFDENGGQKRRARRQLQEEEARLHMEQESQTDVQSLAEAAEEEEPESGSLQLGGEPEDRDNDREPPRGFERRPSAQAPIQRTNNGPVGPGIGNFARNLTNLTHINGRPLTSQQQQQLLMMNQNQPQANFMDDYSPSIRSQLGQGSTLFQQQGHNRQSSRYSFATENSSGSSSIKPSANAKLMAQQSSMMPSGHVQSGAQYYGSSIQAPPGLKSTGTPPSGMFGQNHGFGQAMGSGFSVKSDNNDMLRDMIRGNRGTIGGGQSHDTGKREFMFPSFLQQYPSASSTPAPASGLLASLYGPQTGAFHDFGQKQKKKGKKHRHANTSSSGGGGLVDLVDPSILQARMQHQQQSNAGVGQGLFGSQAQDEQGLPSLDEATLSVDALVADSTADDFIPRSLDTYSIGSRSSTPSIPPGFGPPGLGPPGLGLPHAHPPAKEEAPTQPASRIVGTAAPFAPLTPFTSSKISSLIPRAATPLSKVSVPEPESSAPKPTPESSTLQAKQDVKVLATKTDLSTTIAAQSSQPLQSEDFPALETGKGKIPPTPTPSKIQTVTPVAPTPSKKVVSVTPAKIATPVSTPKTDKRPAILNIATSTQAPTKPTPVPDTPLKVAVPSSEFPSLPPSTPSANTPHVKALRVTIAKTEQPVTGIVTPSSVNSAVAPNFPSRQASLASMSRQERPSTPTSEAISDNLSITSASISRASSPPLSKVGSAPVRNTTKNQQKKQRREAQREKEKTEMEAVAAAATTKIEPEVEIAPIMGRKKKQKKERTIHSAAGGSTPAVSRPSSPGPVDSAQEETRETDKSANSRALSASSNAAPALEKELEDEPKYEAEVHKPNNKRKGKGKHAAPAQLLEVVPAEVEEENPVPEPVKPQTLPTPASTLQALIASGEILDVNILAILKNPAINIKPHPPSEADKHGALQKLTITPDDRARLLAGSPVYKNDADERIMLTPNGDYVRYLDPHEEARYLELQKRIAEQFGPTAFVSNKHHANNGFTLIGGRAVPNGPPSFFPPPKGSGAMLDPVSKIQRDEALSYINQYVLPSLSTNPQLEKALNANALDAEMLRSGNPLSFPSWGNDPAGPRAAGSHGDHGHQEGILATGLEGMTAHFAVGRDGDNGRPLGNVSLLSLAEAEAAMQHARKECEGIDKRMQGLYKKNRRLLLGAGR